MRAVDARHFWMEARAERRDGWNADIYPFNLPIIRTLDTLTFHPKVTFLVGENGSGKSTLIEALAVAWGLNPEGGSRNFGFNTRASHSDLHRFIRPVRGVRRAKDGFFLRAESYFNLGTETFLFCSGGSGGNDKIFWQCCCWQSVGCSVACKEGGWVLEFFKVPLVKAPSAWVSNELMPSSFSSLQTAVCVGPH